MAGSATWRRWLPLTHIGVINGLHGVGWKGCVITLVAQFAKCCLVDLPRLALEAALRVAVVASKENMWPHTQTHIHSHAHMCTAHVFVSAVESCLVPCRLCLSPGRVHVSCRECAWVCMFMILWQHFRFRYAILCAICSYPCNYSPQPPLSLSSFSALCQR